MLTIPQSCQIVRGMTRNEKEEAERKVERFICLQGELERLQAAHDAMERALRDVDSNKPPVVEFNGEGIVLHDLNNFEIAVALLPLIHAKIVAIIKLRDEL